MISYVVNGIYLTDTGGNRKGHFLIQSNKFLFNVFRIIDVYSNVLTLCLFLCLLLCGFMRFTGNSVWILQGVKSIL